MVDKVTYQAKHQPTLPTILFPLILFKLLISVVYSKLKCGLSCVFHVKTYSFKTLIYEKIELFQFHNFLAIQQTIDLLFRVTLLLPIIDSIIIHVYVSRSDDLSGHRFCRWSGESVDPHRSVAVCSLRQLKTKCTFLRRTYVHLNR